MFSLVSSAGRLLLAPNRRSFRQKHYQQTMDGLTLSLRPEPKDDPADREISQLIQRIEAQYGSFRQVTEESLLEEIEKGPMVKDEAESDNVGEEEESKERRKKLDETRMKIVDLVKYVRRPGRFWEQLILILDI